MMPTPPSPPLAQRSPHAPHQKVGHDVDAVVEMAISCAEETASSLLPPAAFPGLTLCLPWILNTALMPIVSKRRQGEGFQLRYE
jgi:hypothetical protein